MTADFKEVSREDFIAFVSMYPRQLSSDICGISEPPLVGYYDFSAAKGIDALVAKYHQHPVPALRVYKVSEHLL